MKPSPKPVRECHGCGLNLDDRCGVYDSPREIWRRHTLCPGYKNEVMLHSYLAEQALHPVDERKQKRIDLARERAQGPQYQGTLTHANR